MKSLNKAKREFREVFNHQPFHYIVVDTTPPISDKTLGEICRVLNNVLALANSMKGSPRIKAVGLALVGSDEKCVLPLHLFKINYQKIVGELANAADHFINVGSSNECPKKETFSRALKEAVSQFNEMVGHDNSKDVLEITILSCQPGMKMIQMVELITKELSFPVTVKVQVVRLTKVYSFATLSSDSPQNQSAISSQSQETVSSDDIADCQPFFIPPEYGFINFDEFQLERLFKNWLHDAGTDREHLRLFIKFGTDDEPIEIKCDLRACLVNPWTLPNGGEYFFGVDQGSVQFCGAPNSKIVTHKVPLYEIDCVKALKTSGICDSLLFGMPITLFPTRCWKIEWEEHERNHTKFIELNEALAKLDLALLCKKRNQFPSDDENGYFLIIPSGGSCMLVKSIAHRDLCLPRNYENIFDSELETPSTERIEKMIERVSTLTIEDKFNPLFISTGLCSRLLNVKGAKRNWNNSVTSTSKDDVEKDRNDVRKSTKSKLPNQTKLKNSQEKRSIAHFEWNKTKTEFQTAARVLANIKKN